jgi:hypothetical protein
MGEVLERARRQPSRTSLFVVGCVLLGVGLYLEVTNHESAGSLFLLVAGVAMVVVACVLPSIRELSLSLTTGFKLKTWEQREREQTAKLADSGRVSTVDHSAVVTVEADELLAADRVLAASWSLPTLLEPAPGGPLAQCDFELYIFDEDENLLLPMFSSYDERVANAWAVGCGATGAAYETGEYVLATGADVWNEKHRLSAEQRERYRNEGLTAVAAMPVLSADRDVIAVVTGSTKEPKPAATVGSSDGYDEQYAMARSVARILVDLLKWFPDFAVGEVEE